MDREIVLSVLMLALGGGALAVAPWWPACPIHTRSARGFERSCWARLWLPLFPAGVTMAALTGWALAEPANAEPVPARMLLLAAPFAAVWLRASLRAGRALRACSDAPAVTVGLLDPQVVISPVLAAALDGPALAAAVAHEAAHALHHDPLRIWLAQLATDLQWPTPRAAQRLRIWLRALELARDEEVRARGIDGADLAAAILVATRLHQAGRAAAAAALIDDSVALRCRIRRLLRPLPPAAVLGSSWVARVFIATTLLAAVSLGWLHGEVMVRLLLGVGT